MLFCMQKEHSEVGVKMLRVVLESTLNSITTTVICFPTEKKSVMIKIDVEFSVLMLTCCLLPEWAIQMPSLAAMSLNAPIPLSP